MMSPQANKADFPINKRPASNANHEKQTHFSMKRKEVSSKRWAKPTQDEKSLAQDTWRCSSYTLLTGNLKKMTMILLIQLNGYSVQHVL